MSKVIVQKTEYRYLSTNGELIVNLLLHSLLVRSINVHDYTSDKATTNVPGCPLHSYLARIDNINVSYFNCIFCFVCLMTGAARCLYDDEEVLHRQDVSFYDSGFHWSR